MSISIYSTVVLWTSTRHLAQDAVALWTEPSFTHIIVVLGPPYRIHCTEGHGSSQTDKNTGQVEFTLEFEIMHVHRLKVPTDGYFQCNVRVIIMTPDIFRMISDKILIKAKIVITSRS